MTRQGFCEVGMKDSSPVSSNRPDWSGLIYPDLYCAGGPLAVEQALLWGTLGDFCPAFSLRFPSVSYKRVFPASDTFSDNL